MIRAGIILVILSGAVGCGRTPNPLYPMVEPSPGSVSTDPDQYDPTASGRIHGQVAWKGSRPDEASFYYSTLLPGEQSLREPLRDPLIPRINQHGGLGDVVVYLREVNPHRSRPWDLSDVRVEIQNEQMRVVQGNATNSRFGFVRVGKEVEMVCRDQNTQLIRGRDAAFFTISLAKVNEPRHQRCSKLGRVELSRASMQYWMRTWIYVSDHPYFARTNDVGEFELNDVPEGTYDLVSIVPNWHLERAERDPELMGFARAWYRPMVEQTRRVEVKRGATTKEDFEVRKEDFDERTKPSAKN